MHMKQFLNTIENFIPKERIYTDAMRRLAWGTDASFYRLVPQVVIASKNEDEVCRILFEANKSQTAITFRAAGTSLSGQALSESVLLIAGNRWENYKLAPDASSISLQPGIVGQRVNEILKPYGKKFSPDPASVKSAMIGGIIANNASGMSCGTHENSYRIIQSARIILPDGTLLDTGCHESKTAFAQSHAHLLDKIIEIRNRIRNNKTLTERIKRKYSIKNVTGLNILPFVEFNDPFDIITHLIVGAEGTLAFIAEVTVRTIDELPHKASALLYLPNMQTACETVIQLKNSSVTAVELFDRTAIRSVENKPNAIPVLKTLPNDAAVLLIKTEGATPDTLKKNMLEVENILANCQLLHPASFTDKANEYNAYWEMRSGIFPTVGSTRPVGTSCIIEDIAFHIDDLPQATADLRIILEKYDYNDAVIYGHALEGNFHFIINQSFDTQQEIERYDNMMNEVIDLVVDKYDGSLKAEHGTGRNMAPFVKREWGEEAYDIMFEIKNTFDPNNILNPGVIFNNDPLCHLNNLKALPETHPIIDKCIECGFCEINCVSNGFTLSSRQRIVVQREVQRLKTTNENPQLLAHLEKDFEYAGNATCAGDGLCATSCPVDINVGEYIHEFRKDNNSAFAYKLGKLSANNFSKVSGGLKFMLSVANGTRNILGNKKMSSLTSAMRTISGNKMPLWTPTLPQPAAKIENSNFVSNLKVVYFPSCLNQMMGTSENDPSSVQLSQHMVHLLNKAGYQVIFPEKMNNMCCGTIWESKGMPEIADSKTAELELALYKASENGKFPVLCDQSPCLMRMRHKMQNLRLYEPIEFIDLFLLDKLDFHPTNETVTVFPTCSTVKMGLSGSLVKIAKLCSSNVHVPVELACCGFAGDKGFFVPELNVHGLRKLRNQVEKAGATSGYSNSRTCEIGLNTQSGIPYQSIVYLVNKCSSAKH